MNTYYNDPSRLMKTHRWLYFVILCMAVGGPIISSSGMDIVRDGQAHAVIVTPANALPVVQYAAQELCWHVEKASGAKLPIVTEDRVEPSQTTRIYLGECAETRKVGVDPSKLPVNACIVRVMGDSMFLVGVDGKGVLPSDDATPMGTLFAVYEWLDTQMGVRWLWPGELGTYVPVWKTIISGPEGEAVFQPPFIHTNLRYDGGSDYLNWWRGVVSEKERNDFVRGTATWLRRQRFSRSVSLRYGHAYGEYWERFGKAHPDWFAQRADGTRGPVDKNYELVQMCVSNPGLHKQIIADWLESRKKDPSLPWINGNENDRRTEDPSCQCDRCRSWDPQKPQIVSGANPYLVASGKGDDAKASPAISLSDRYAKFWLALQAEGRKHDPEATVVGGAYGDYSEPPLETKLNDHIILRMTPPYCYPFLTGTNDKFKQFWDGWAKTGARLVLRPNYTLFGSCMPYIYAEQFGQEFRHAYKHGLIGTDFDSLTSMWGVQGPNLYMLGRIHAKPQMEVSAILDEYYSGFGPAANRVRAYFKYWKDVTDRVGTLGDDAGSWWDILSNRYTKIFTPDTFDKGESLLQEALRAAKADATACARVEFLQKGLKHARLTMDTTLAFQAVKKAPGESKVSNKYLNSMKTLDEYRNEIKNDFVADIVFMQWAEGNCGYPRLQVQMEGRYERICPLPLFWAFQWDPQAIGKNSKWYTPDYDDSAWLKARTDAFYEKQPVGEEWKEKHGVDYLGLTWYRTTFSLPEKAKGRKLLLYFGSVDEGCIIWVNGQQVIERHYNAQENQYSWRDPFVVDVSEAVHFGKPNVVAVQVENAAGMGGIWKPCSVVAAY